jgi:hypothetical protein
MHTCVACVHAQHEWSSKAAVQVLDVQQACRTLEDATASSKFAVLSRFANFSASEPKFPTLPKSLSLELAADTPSDAVSPGPLRLPPGPGAALCAYHAVFVTYGVKLLGVTLPSFHPSGCAQAEALLG